MYQFLIIAYLFTLLTNQLEVGPNIKIPSDLVRLGRKKSSDPEKARPLRFKVKDIDSKNILLRAGNLLRNSRDKSIKNIYITPDLTKRQRDDAYKLRQEKKQRQGEGEENLRIVRGKIIKNQPRSKPTRPVSGRKLRYKWYEPHRQPRR